jgi:hypothetical protein
MDRSRTGVIASFRPLHAIGGAGSDYIEGRFGRDIVRGGPGGDECLSTSDDDPGDVVVGGQGIDTFEVDRGDDKRSVETRMNCV